MPDKIYGDVEVFGVVTVGARTGAVSGESYTLPYNKGGVGSVLGIVNGISGSLPQWVDPTQSPFNLVTSDDMTTLVSSTSAATLNQANAFTLANILSTSVKISGVNGIQVTEITANQFLISLYVPLTASLVTVPSSIEIGQTITGSNLSWSYNKSVVSQTLGDGAYTTPLPFAQRSYVYISPISSAKTFTITGNDGFQNAFSSASISVYRRRYWGTISATTGGTPTNAQILAASSELASSRSKSITYNCSTPASGNHWWYTYPVTMGLASVTVNNLVFTDWYDPSNPPSATTSPATITVTNSYGHSESYYMYRVYNTQFGASIPVVFS